MPDLTESESRDIGEVMNLSGNGDNVIDIDEFL